MPIRPASRIEPYRSTAAVALVVVVLLALNIPTALANVWEDFQQGEMLDRVLAAHRGDPGSEPMSDEDLEAHDERAASIALVWLAVYAVTAIVWITWFKRMYANLPALGATHLKYTPGWAAGGWFVPFLNLIRPYEIAQEIWAGSAPRPEPPPPPPAPAAQLGGAELEETRLERRRERMRARAQANSSMLLRVWWFSWIGSNIFAAAAARIEGAAMKSVERATSDTSYTSAMESFQSATTVTTVSDLLDIPMVILAILTVRALDARQQAKAAESAAREPCA